MLTRDEIALILKKLSWVIVVPPTREFPFHIVKEGFGYSDDVEVGRLQAKLSIMLQAATKNPLVD
jgi:hypothetical protein